MHPAQALHDTCAMLVELVVVSMAVTMVVVAPRPEVEWMGRLVALLPQQHARLQRLVLLQLAMVMVMAIVMVMVMLVLPLLHLQLSWLLSAQ